MKRQSRKKLKLWFFKLFDLRAIIFFFCLITVSCNQGKKENSAGKISQVQQQIQPRDTSISKGIIHPEISCFKDAGQSYALYLPSSYSAGKPFPVIYFFDSHAEGLLPVKKYRLLAEKYGYIIACSNNSKNGLPRETTQKVIGVFFEDTQQKFSIDPKRIYTSGFSGGARVAASVAVFNGGIAGVAGCGAGFPKLDGPVPGKFSYIGVVGNADFNLIEMKNLDRTLETTSLIHQLVVFDGKHEWPPMETMEEAFRFFEISAMKNGLAEKNDSLIREYIHSQENKIKYLKGKNQLVALWDLYRKLSGNLYGLEDVSKFKEEIVSIENSPELIKALQKEMDEEKSEVAKQQEYAKAFTKNDFFWWTNEVKSLNSEKSLRAKRLLGYLGLAGYMYAAEASNKNMVREANAFLKIYALVEPENPEPHYLYARLFMKTNQPEKAMASLNTAVELGFRDKERLGNDEALSPLRSRTEFKDLFSKMKASGLVNSN